MEILLFFFCFKFWTFFRFGFWHLIFTQLKESKMYCRRIAHHLDRMKRKVSKKSSTKLIVLREKKPKFITSYLFFFCCAQIFIRKFYIVEYDYINIARSRIKAIDHVEIKAIKLRAMICSAIVLCLHKLGEWYRSDLFYFESVCVCVCMNFFSLPNVINWPRNKQAVTK